jgi:hypothetical protein
MFLLPKKQQNKYTKISEDDYLTYSTTVTIK